MLLEQLLNESDVAGLVLRSLDPTSLVALGRTCRGAREAVRAQADASPALLVAVARNSKRSMTKAHVMAFFALSSAEADVLPRVACPRKNGGHYYLYDTAAYEGVPTIYAASGCRYATRMARRRGHAVRAPARPPRRRYAAKDMRSPYWVPTRVGDCVRYRSAVFV